MQKKINEVMQQAHQILSDGPLVPREGEIKQEDADRVERFLLSAFQPDGENYRPLMHLLMTGKMAAELAGRLGHNPHAHRIAGMLHDIGRLLSSRRSDVNPHRYHRNDVVGDVLLRKLQLRPDVQDMLQPNITYTQTPESMDDFTEAQRITIIADICGKRADDGSIKSFEDILKYHYESRGKQADASNFLWASEKAGHREATPEAVDQWGKIYEQIVTWMKMKGVDVEEVRQQMEQQEREAPVDTIVFDVGGVLISDSDPAIIADFCTTLGIDEATLQQYWNGIVVPLQTGAITEDEFWLAFEAKLGRPVPAEHRGLFNRHFQAAINPQMHKLLKNLKAKGHTLMALSDTIPPHAKALRDAGTYDQFEKVLLSPDIHCSKKAGSTYQRNSELASFCIAALHSGKPRAAHVFIDDRQKYVDLADQAGMKGITFKNADALEAELRERGLL